MTAIEELRSYIERLRRRFQLAALARGVAVVAAIALVVTLLLTVVANHFAFSGASLWTARTALLVSLAAGALLGLGLPLWRLRHHLLSRTERLFPQFDLRLRTFVDRDRAGHDPFLSLLAADTLRVAQAADVREVARGTTLAGFAAAGALCAGALIWLIRSGPGYLGYGAAALWLGPPAAPLYDIRVTPGDAVVDRHADQLVTATLVGENNSQVRIHVRPTHATSFEQAAMQARPSATGFQFLIPGVAEDVEYFVDAGAVESAHFHLRVADNPHVRQIRVTYHHPQWTNLGDSVEEHGGDVRAVEGTEAQLEVVTDRPLEGGALVLDDGRRIELATGQKNVYRGAITLDRDGLYHVVSKEQTGEQRISGDYFIEAQPIKPPEVALTQPAKDFLASPIEEVAIAAHASDPYGLSELELHYSVNGGPEKKLDLLKAKGANAATGSSVINLERLNLVPGDVISLYALAKDARSDAHTDIGFIQIEPFERQFSQSQQTGGAGGGGGAKDNQAQIAEREKEIIAATWKQNGLKGAEAKGAAEQSKFLSDVQTTLRTQAMSLSGRLQKRDLQLANEQFSSFQQDMHSAATAMGPAADELQEQKWVAAVSNEQRALQFLLRAEATYRQIEVAFGSRGSSGGVNSAGRDLASLFDLELDTQKNQYDSEQTASSASQRSSAIDDALRKLDELERRQRQLSAQGQNAPQTAEDRWQQEILRRKAEELQAQMEQLARSGQQGGSSASGQQGKSSASGQQGKSGASEQALSRLRQAEADMAQAVNERGSERAREAANKLRDAMSLLGGLQQQDVASRVESLAHEAGRIADEQRAQAERLKGISDARSAMNRQAPPPRPQDVRQFIEDRQKLADDLSRLTGNLHSAEDAARQRNHSAADTLHAALSDLEQADTETQLQRSADLLRRGYGPLTDAVESESRDALQHLKGQVAAAGQAMANADARPDNPLDHLERLRARLASAGGGSGPVDGGFDIGVDPSAQGRAGPHAVGPEHAGVAPQTAQNYQAELGELGKLRRSVGEDTEARSQVDELIKSMKGLDPGRFPGNPQMVEALYAKTLSSVDKLELQLRRLPDQTTSVEVRTDNPAPVPSEYQAAVADYFRRLSKSPQEPSSAK